jgi:hypothetical protein
MENKLTIKCLLASLALLLPAFTESQNLLNAPQKIVIDALRNRLLVSNFNTGDIIQIDTAGNQAYFVQGAGFIDGMEIVGDTVYGVADGRKIKAYDLVTKQLVMDLTLAGSASDYLSSISSDSAGHLFISCPFQNVVYKLRIRDRAYWVFAQNNGLTKPNGILLEKDKNRIVVVGDAPAPSSVCAVGLSDSAVSIITTTTLNSPDGIVRDKYGYHYIAGYYLAGIYKTDAGFGQAPQLFFPGNSMVYPTYDKSDNSLLVTHYNTNTWERVPLETSGIAFSENQAGCLLYAASPNPFRGITSFRFSVDQPAHISIDIFDSAGVMVKTLVNEEKVSGIYSSAWDGKVQSGNQAAEGSYFIRMTANGIVQTRKVMLVR